MLMGTAVASLKVDAGNELAAQRDPLRKIVTPLRKNEAPKMKLHLRLGRAVLGMVEIWSGAISDIVKLPG